MRTTATRRRIVCGLLLAALAGAALAGCGSSSGSKTTAGTGTSTSAGAHKKIIYFVFAPRGFNDVTRAWANGIDAGGQSLGSGFTVEQKATGQAESDPAAYLTFIRTALVEHPDGIVVVPNNAAAMKTGLEQIAASGTPVLIMNQDVANMRGKVSFVGGSYTSAGQTAARWLIGEQQAGRLKSNEVGILRSTPGISTTDDGLTGFENALKGSALRVVSVLQPSSLDSADARAKAADMLTAHPNLGAIYSVTDIFGLGVARALSDANRLDIKSISVDATPATIHLMLTHRGIDAEVALNKYQEGLLSVETLGKYLSGQQVPASMPLSAKLITADNAQAYLQQAAQLSK